MSFSFGLDIGSLLNFITSIGAGSAAHKRNVDLMNRQNRFNAGEAALNREFQSNEAQLARQWQENFYNQFQSPQAMVHQYEAAGMNPVLATGVPISSPPSASSAQGSMAQGAAAPYMDVIGIMAQFQNLMKLDAEIKNINKDTEEKESRIGVNKADVTYKESLKNLTDNQVQLVKGQFRKVAAEAKNEEYRHNILLLEKEITEMQRNQDLREQEFHQKYGVYPNDSVQAIILKLLDRKGEQFKNWFLRTMTELNNSFTLPDYSKQ